MSQHDPFTKRLLRGGYRQACGLLTAANALAPREAGQGVPVVYYGGARVGDVGGPLVKVKRLNEYFPEQRWGYNLAYLLSNTPYLPPYALAMLKRRGVPIVYNQNGVFYEAWFDGDWQGENRRMARAYHAADHVFYQSAFCRKAADRFLGVREGAGEILYNAVDTSRFTPAERAPAGDDFIFLVTGKIGNHLAYRLESTIAGLAHARRGGLAARLVVAGWVEEGARAQAAQLAESLGVAAVVDYVGAYTQEQAPDLYRSAHSYVMTKHNDPCPNTVLEALSCGLPVLYSDSGGVPELVGTDAGVPLAAPEDWEESYVPPADAVGAGMLRIAAGHAEFAQAARARAVERFDITHWIARHRAVFEALLQRTGG